MRTIDRDNVHAGEYIVKAFRIRCLEFAFNLRDDTTAVMIVNLQAERTCPAGNRLADSSHTDNAEALSTDAVTEHPGGRPTGPLLFRSHNRCALRQTARYSQYQRHRHVRGVFCEDPRRVGDCDAPLEGG